MMRRFILRRIAMTFKTFGMAAVVAVAAAGFVFSTSAAKAEICTLDWKPVCADDHGIKHTYSNACLANLWGAKVISQSACGAKPAKKAAKKKKKMKT
jgi:Kazal-type serine protease inhibitor domain